MSSYNTYINFKDMVNVDNSYGVSFVPKKTGEFTIELIRDENNGPLYKSNSLRNAIIVVTMDRDCRERYVITYHIACQMVWCMYDFEIMDRLGVVTHSGVSVPHGGSEEFTIIEKEQITAVIHRKEVY